MTKTLTEQWREGTLQDREYYVLRDDGEVEKLTWNDGLFFDMDVPLYEEDEERIKEVLAPVPSYDEYKELVSKTDKLEKMAFHYTPEEWNTMLRKVERLQKQLNEANELISLLFPLSMNKERALERTAEYMKKWGVK